MLQLGGHQRLQHHRRPANARLGQSQDPKLPGPADAESRDGRGREDEAAGVEERLPRADAGQRRGRGRGGAGQVGHAAEQRDAVPGAGRRAGRPVRRARRLHGRLLVEAAQAEGPTR